jgi:heterotetrameric sarcosine oxidase gamma subunit
MSGGRYRAQVTDLPMMALFEARGRQPALMAALAAAGLPWPQASGVIDASAAGVQVMRFGPARVLVTAELAREAELDRMLEAAFASQPDADVALVSDMFRGFRISGAGAEDVLRQGAPLDLSRAVLPDGSAAATELWAVSAIISREAAAEPAFTEPAFTVLVDHSHAGYIADWLSAANGGAPLASPGVMTNPPPAISA